MNYNKAIKKLHRKIKEGRYKTAFSLYQAKNSVYRRRLKNTPTEAELIFKKYLIQEKIPFIFQKGFLIPFHRICDFYIPGKKIIIEIDD